MCGITGWVSYQRDLTLERPTLDEMTETMACRGPDASGTWLAQHVAIGHRRLAIIDLPGGVQPMSVDTPAGTVVMTYSGEAYNYRELREELRGCGHRFTTNSDTEVVLRGYLEWGAEVAERLNGMYAFAIWDARENILVLIRDRLGVKPLYYYPTSDGALFGSEPKAILANPLAKRVIDTAGLRALCLLIDVPDQAVWADMRKVNPGTVVTITAAGIRHRTYWSLQPGEHTDDRQETIAHIRELLDDTIARQLISDVPRCTLLSGGLDSSVITALAALHLRTLGETVRSFTVDFTGGPANFVPDDLRATSDALFAHDVAAHVSTQHQDIVLDSNALADLDARIAVVRARDCPAGFGDSDISLYLLFKAIREHSTVALSGESADEVFAGYRWFHNPTALQAGTFPWLAGAPRWIGQRTSILAPPVAKALDVSHYIQDSYHSAVATVHRQDGESDIDYQTRVASHLHFTRMLGLLLDRKDRMSMAVGLEVRVPYCDHRLVEYLYTVPWSLKTYDGREKSLLRAAAADALPRSVVERVKSHYPQTHDPAYTRAIQRHAKDLLADSDHPVFELINRDTLTNALVAAPDQLALSNRVDLEQAIDFAIWLDSYRPSIHID